MLSSAFSVIHELYVHLNKDIDTQLVFQKNVEKWAASQIDKTKVLVLTLNLLLEHL